MNSLLVSKKALFQYTLLYLLYISTGSVFYHYNSGFFINLILVISALVFFRRKQLPPTKLLLGWGVIGFGMFFSRFLNSGGLGIQAFLPILSSSIIVYTVYMIEPEKAIDRYIKLTYTLAIISIICWLMGLVAPELLRSLLIGNTDMFKGTQGSFIYSFRYASFAEGDLRNNGIFSEPGRYQIVLNTAIYFLLFAKNGINCTEKERMKYLIVLGVTLLTTQSTTGYGGCAVCILAYLLMYNDKTKKQIVRLIVILGIIVFIDFSIRGNDSLLYSAVLSKVFTETGQFDLAADSGVWRMNGIINYLAIIKDYPLGCGDNYVNLFWTYSGGLSSAGTGMLVFTAATGLISLFGVLMVYIWPMIEKKVKLIPFLVYIFLFINTTNAQANIMYGCIMCIAVFTPCLSFEMNSISKEGEDYYENRDSYLS